MSDKFFFKGRQDARQNHVKHGYQTKANKKLGTKKYPLTLIVTNEARKQELEAIIADAQLFADISIDTRNGATESINELSAVLSKKSAVKQEQTLSRNEPCSCGSGKKYKKCCGQ